MTGYYGASSHQNLQVETWENPHLNIPIYANLGIMIYVKSNIVGSPPTQKNEGYKEASAIIKEVKGYDSQHSRLCNLTENSTNLFMPAEGKPRQRFERF